MPRTTAFDLDSQQIGALPLVNHVIERLRIEPLVTSRDLDPSIPTDLDPRP